MKYTSARGIEGIAFTILQYDLDVYSFTFVKENKLISVYASDYDLLNEIETS